MQAQSDRRGIIGAALAVFCATSVHGAELRLEVQDFLGPYDPGDTVIVKVSMADLGGFEAVGFQAFLSFDTGTLEFLGGTYIDEPFGLPVIPIIVADGVNIDMASGTDVESGQQPTSADSDLAILFFEALEPICLPDVIFRHHEPPHRITDDLGNPADPLELVFITATSDCNNNDVEDLCDIDDGTSRDCNFNGVPDECETLSCPADYTGPEGVSDGVVNILEFLLMLAQWGGTGCADFWGPAEEPDGVVDVLDFLALLAFWGPCP
ncbi:MAG: GC-type dockerin domain-anchored protein [Planctomycetota bacterium]|jgi:hypothetical protein